MGGCKFRNAVYCILELHLDPPSSPRSKQIPEIIRVKETTILALNINNMNILLLRVSCRVSTLIPGSYEQQPWNTRPTHLPQDQSPTPDKPLTAIYNQQLPHNGAYSVASSVFSFSLFSPSSSSIFSSSSFNRSSVDSNACEPLSNSLIFFANENFSRSSLIISPAWLARLGELAEESSVDLDNSNFLLNATPSIPIMDYGGVEGGPLRIARDSSMCLSRTLEIWESESSMRKMACRSELIWKANIRRELL
jgi:hypothetical protein